MLVVLQFLERTTTKGEKHWVGVSFRLFSLVLVWFWFLPGDAVGVECFSFWNCFLFFCFLFLFLAEFWDSFKPVNILFAAAVYLRGTGFLGEALHTV